MNKQSQLGRMVAWASDSRRFQGGRHLVYPDHTPLANLELTLLANLGVPTEKLGDSAGTFAELCGLCSASA